MSILIKILAWLTGSSIGRYVAIAGIVALAVAYVVVRSYFAGRNSVKVKQQKQLIEKMKKGLEIDAEVNRMSRADRERYWSSILRD